jgi:hypothetical protein
LPLFLLQSVHSAQKIVDVDHGRFVMILSRSKVKR